MGKERGGYSGGLRLDIGRRLRRSKGKLQARGWRRKIMIIVIISHRGVTFALARYAFVGILDSVLRIWYFFAPERPTPRLSCQTTDYKLSLSVVL